MYQAPAINAPSPALDRHRQLVLPFSLAAGEERELILRMQTEGSANLSASLMSAQAFSHHEQRMLMLQGLFFGALLVMLIYNLSIFSITRDRNYLWYSLFVASFSFYQFIQQGFALQWLWPNSLTWHQLSFPFSSALATLFGIFFTYGILDLKSQHRSLHLGQSRPAGRQPAGDGASPDGALTRWRCSAALRC